MKKTLLMGTDPEFALKNSENRIVSAIPVLERDKNNKILLDGKSTAIYFDNVLAEGNIPPASSKEELKQNLRNLYAKAKEVLKGHKLSATASYTFDDLECMHPEAMRFGCDPELDAYMGGPAYPPQGGNSFRSAGGHIHIGGLTKKNIYEKEILVFLMDIMVGIPSVLMDNDPSSPARKVLYGKAGRFRNTSYGLEYRTLSNYWLSSPELTEINYDLTMAAAQLFEDGKAPEIVEQFDLDSIADIINSCNRDAAAKVIEQLPISNDLKDTIFNLANRQYSDDIFQNWEIK